MAEPWFDPNLYGWIPGTLLGVIGGGIGGPLAGVLAPKGKCKRLVMGFYYTTVFVCLLLLLVGLIALLGGQPYGVWYGLGLPGVGGVVIFLPLTRLVASRYRESEMRKSISQDL